MRRIQLWSAALCALMLLAACTDAPTAPQMPAVEQGVSTSPAFDSQTPQGCVIDGLCLLPPISGGGSTCDPYLELDWSCDDGGGDCMTGSPGAEADTAYVGFAGCPGPTGPGTGGGGYFPEPSDPEPAPADTCNTGDQVVESKAIQQAFAAIWAESNYGPTVPHADRREQGGWITSDPAGGMQFTPFPSTWARTPCQIVVPDSFAVPSNLVAWVHTHPYANGEELTECEKMALPGGLQLPFTYSGDPSYGDDALTRKLRENGFPNVRGYIIDADKITWYTGSDTSGTVGDYPRCGY